MRFTGCAEHVATKVLMPAAGASIALQRPLVSEG